MKKALGKPADIWSVGCVALEMLTGSPPWKGLAKNNDELTRLITSGSKNWEFGLKLNRSSTPKFPFRYIGILPGFLDKNFEIQTRG